MVDLSILGPFFLMIARDAFWAVTAVLAAFYIAYTLIDIIVQALSGEMPTKE